MIIVTVLQKEGCITGLSLEGHAGYDVRGRDIVCSAASTLVQALEIGLKDVMGFSHKVVFVRRNDEKGLMVVEWLKESGIGDSVLFQTVLRSLEAIAAGYPENMHIKEDSTL